MSEIREMTELEVRLFTEMNKARAEAREKDAEIERLEDTILKWWEYGSVSGSDHLLIEADRIRAKREGR